MSSLGTQQGTILVVDDESEILVALEDLFDGLYRVRATTSPHEALRILEDGEDVWVIISDQRMPEMTGDAFLREARRFTDAEAILLTGYADIDAVAAAINQGGIVGYSPKPWEAPVLMSMVSGAYERYRLGRDLERERQLFSGLLDNAPDAVCYKDGGGRIVRLNGVKAAFLGRDADACLGLSEAELGHPDAHEADMAAIVGGETVEAVEERDNGLGGSRWASISRIPLAATPGSEARLVVIERDITDSRRLEERLRQADKLQALGTLAGGVAHDFNNLLTAVLGNLRLALKSSEEESRQRRQIENAILAAERGSGLTQRLLSFSRAKGIKTEPVNVGALIDGMDDLLLRTLGGMVGLEKHVDAGLWPATADPEELELVVLNLCINARDAMPDGGTITIEARNRTLREGEIDGLPGGGYIHLSIGDTGTGMPPDVLQRALEPFFTTKGSKGTGLGLSMAYGVAQQLGGTLQIESAPGKGTIISIHLPRTSMEPGAGERRDDAIPGADPARILLVDDDDSVREVVAEHLRDLGHAVVMAGDAQGALDLLARGSTFDLVLADFAMPGMTGADLVNRMRERSCDIPVMLISGYADFERIPQGLPVLMKPYQDAELARRLSDILRGRRRVV